MRTNVSSFSFEQKTSSGGRAEETKPRKCSTGEEICSSRSEKCSNLTIFYTVIATKIRDITLGNVAEWHILLQNLPLRPKNVANIVRK